MTRKFHIMSIEDREMFAYNREYNERQRILSHPELRIRYSMEFLNGYVHDGDEGMKKKCYDAIAKYSNQLDYSESHY